MAYAVSGGVTPDDGGALETSESEFRLTHELHNALTEILQSIKPDPENYRSILAQTDNLYKSVCVEGPDKLFGSIKLELVDAEAWKEAREAGLGCRAYSIVKPPLTVRISGLRDHLTYALFVDLVLLEPKKYGRTFDGVSTWITTTDVYPPNDPGGKKHYPIHVHSIQLGPRVYCSKAGLFQGAAVKEAPPELSGCAITTNINQRIGENVVCLGLYT